MGIQPAFTHAFPKPTRQPNARNGARIASTLLKATTSATAATTTAIRSGRRELDLALAGLSAMATEITRSLSAMLSRGKVGADPRAPFDPKPVPHGGLHAAATERNREPILEVLRRVLPARGSSSR